MEETKYSTFLNNEELKLLGNNDVELFEQNLITNYENLKKVYEKLKLLQEKIKIQSDKINSIIEQIEKYRKIDKKNKEEFNSCCPILIFLTYGFLVIILTVIAS